MLTVVGAIAGNRDNLSRRAVKRASAAALGPLRTYLYTCCTRPAQERHGFPFSLALILYVRALPYLLRHGHPVALVLVVRPPVPPVHVPSRSCCPRPHLPNSSLRVALAAAAPPRTSSRQRVRLLRSRTVTPATGLVEWAALVQ